MPEGYLEVRRRGVYQVNETVSTFISEAAEQLGQLLEESGKVLYSSARTLQKGDFYILGLNPGGSRERGRRICDSLQDLVEGKPWNDYCDEPWHPYKAGNHPLQRNVRQLVQALGLDLESICSSNLVFMRTPGQEGIILPYHGDLCWPVHEMILSIVRPQTIFAFGNGSESTYSYLVAKWGREKTVREGPWVSPRGRLRAFKGLRAGQAITVVGLPHLSRNAVHKSLDALDWIRGELAA
jgi:hypothetical protein